MGNGKLESHKKMRAKIKSAKNNLIRIKIIKRKEMKPKVQKIIK
jgi:hypothetical protein